MVLWVLMFSLQKLFTRFQLKPHRRAFRARPFHSGHQSLAVDLVGRSPKAWLYGGAPGPKCHDKKVVDSGSEAWQGRLVLFLLQLFLQTFCTRSPRFQSRGCKTSCSIQTKSSKDKFVQCPKDCPIYADDRADGIDCNFECVEVNQTDRVVLVRVTRTDRI